MKLDDAKLKYGGVFCTDGFKVGKVKVTLIR